MTEQVGIHRSYWLEGQPLRQRFEPLSTTHQSDVAIIGAGITGLSTALELLERGLSVAVYEASIIGGGTTGGSTGHLDAHPETGAVALIDQVGASLARQMIQWRLDAIALIKSRSCDRCDFKTVPGWYYSESEEDREQVQREADVSREIGLNAKWSDAMPLPHAVVGFRIDEMARINTMAYLNQLADLVVQRGGQIFERTLAYPPEGDSSEAIKAGTGTAQYRHLVCAVHSNLIDAMKVDIQIPPYQSYAIAAEVKETIPDGLMWDNQDPYHYVRRATSTDPAQIVVGGCDHRTGSGDELQAIADLESYVRNRFTVRQIRSRWSAELFEPSDGLPLIGRAPGKENVYLATGLSGVGLTQGTGAAKMIADLIVGNETPLHAAFDPSRFPLSKLPSIAAEQSNALPSYVDRVLPAKNLKVETLFAGEGEVGKVDGEFLAACRDQEGKLHLQSPICKHMGGVVRWNSAEQTWDCPVHGGRYAACGKRLYGPPLDDLDPPAKDHP